MPNPLNPHQSDGQRVTVTNVGPGIVSVQQPPGAQGVPIKVGAAASLEVGPEGFKVVLG